MNCSCSIHSAFRWKEDRRPSIFSRDGQFTPYGASGKTKSETASESVDRVTGRTGRNPGSIFGISSQADRLTEQSIVDRKGARRG